MTLSTNVAVRLPAEHNVQPLDVLNALIRALIEAGGPWQRDLEPFKWDSINYAPASTEMPEVTDGSRYSESDETGRIGTVIGQGFHAITDITYRRDGAPLYMKDMTNGELYAEDYDDDAPMDEGYAAKLGQPACTFLLDMDTAYGARYSQANGALPGVTGCTTLHAAAIGVFNAWVVEHHGTVVWQNEYAGTWHDMDDAEGWAAFAGSGDDAQQWFKNVAKPAIAALIAGE